MATKTKKAAPKKKAAEPTTDSFSQFLPQAGQDVHEYLKGVSLDPSRIPGRADPEPEPKPSVTVRPLEMASMMERQVKMSRAQDISQEELAAPKEALGVKSDFVTSQKGGGTYDYGTGAYYHPNSYGSSLSHFTEFHRIHNIVEHALDKHSALATIDVAPGSNTRTGPYDEVAKHLRRASGSIDRALAKHTEGALLSKEQGPASIGPIDRGAVSHFTEAIQHLKNASSELSVRTNGEFASIDSLASSLHDSYKKKIDSASSALSLMTAQQRKLEKRGLIRDEDDTPAKPEALRLPLGRKGYNVVRNRIRKAKDAELVEEAAGRRPRTGAVVAGAPREMLIAKPANVSGGMNFKPQKNEVDPETGRQQISERITSKMAESAKVAETALSTVREKRRKAAQKAFNTPERIQENQAQREDLRAEVISRSTPFPQSEGRMTAFRAQQEGTSLTTGKPQRGTAVRDAPMLTDSVTSRETAHRAIIEGHIAEGNITQAALHHYKNLGDVLRPKQDKDTGKWTDAAQQEIARNPYRYLAKHGFDAGTKPRQVQERTEAPGRATPRIRVTAAPATGPTGQIVSRAKLNTAAPTSPRTAPSMFSSESPEQYEARQAADKKASSRAQRNNAAFKGD